MGQRNHLALLNLQKVYNLVKGSLFVIVYVVHFDTI